MLKRLLAHPLTRDLDLDSAKTTHLRRRIIREKRFLNSIYLEWYQTLAEVIPQAVGHHSGPVLELGSGGGFFREIFPESISSDVFWCEGNDLVLDGRSLPFQASSLRAIVMVDVFHHIPDTPAFLEEAQRVLQPGGVIAMWEPWNTAWSRFIYQNLHHEPFDCDVEKWEFPQGGPLSSANGALPWLVFERDAGLFARLFPGLRVEHIRLDYPFSYLASGGVSLRALALGQLFRPMRSLERAMAKWMRHLGMFAFIVIRRI